MVRPFSEIFQNKIDSPLFLVPFFFVFFFIIVTECKKRWSTLRDTYRKSLRSQRTKSGEGAKKKKIWRYDKHMSFLRCFLVDRQQISNVEQCDSSEDETQEREEDSNVTDDVSSPSSIPKGPSTSKPCSSASNTSQTSTHKGSKQAKKTLSSAEVLHDYLKEKNSQKKTPLERQNASDAISKFFDCMAETVKTLSPQLQIEVKSKVFAIVSDAEIKNLNFSPISPTTSQKVTLISNQPPRSTNVPQQNRVTMPQPHFHQQQQHQLPYPQPQTQHSPAISPKPFSQSQSLLSSYSQQHIPFASVLQPTTSFTEHFDDNNDDNDLTQI